MGHAIMIAKIFNFSYLIGEVRLRRELQRRVHEGRALHRRRRPTATQVRRKLHCTKITILNYSSFLSLKASDHCADPAGGLRRLLHRPPPHAPPRLRLRPQRLGPGRGQPRPAARRLSRRAARRQAALSEGEEGRHRKIQVIVRCHVDVTSDWHW